MIHKLLFFILACSLSFIAECQLADSCNNYSFQRLYTLPSGTPGQVNDVLENADGTLVAVGEVAGSAMIMKTTRKGDVIWAKKIAANSTDKFQRMKKTLDGGYLAIGITNSFGGFYLVKFTATGNLTWAHAFPEPTLNNISDAIQTSDGGYAIIMQSGPPNLGVISVLRLDNNANTTWTKEYKVNGFFVTASWPGGILEENDSLVISGAVEDTLTGVFPTYEYHTLTKISKTNGNVYWAKRWSGGTFFSGIVKYNNFYYISHDLNGQRVATKLDINGNIVKSIYLTDALNNTNTSGLNMICPTHDNGLLMGRINSKLNVAKIAANDSIQWSNQYPIIGATSSSFFCIKESSNNEIIVGGKTIAPSNASSGILLSKLSADGSAGNCPIAPFATSVASFALVSHPFTWTWIHSDPISNNFVGPTVTDINFTITTLCSTIVNCDSLRLSGAATACMNTDTINYIAHRNPNCFSTVGFQVDPARGTVVSSNDTSARVVFSSAGVVKVYASIINPCGILKDSITVTVNNCSPIIDTCSNYSFQKIYTLQASIQNEISDVVENPDGTLVLAGFIDNTTPFTTVHVAGLVMKVKKNGDVAWIKKIGGNWRDKFHHIKKTADGGYIACGNTDSYFGTLVVKLDSSGNITWARLLGLIQNATDEVIQLSDGTYVIAMENTNSSPTHLELVKLDAGGNTLWTKVFYTMINSSPGVSYSGGLIEENDSLVFSGTHQDSSGAFLYFNSITKINKNDGSVFWSKRWSGSSQASPLIKVNNFYYIAHRVNNQNVITKLDLSGNIVKCSNLSDTFNSPYNLILNTIGVTHNNDLLISRVTNQLSPEILNLAKVSPAGVVQWANIYPMPFTSFLTNIKESNNNQILAVGTVGVPIIISRLKPDGTNSICPRTPFISNEITIPITSQFFTWNFYSEFFFFNNIITPPIADVTYTLNTLCSSVVNCDSLKFSGQDSACMNSDTIIYTAHRNINCFSTVQFSVDPIKGRIVSSTDTSAKIVFIQPGFTKVFASISNSCGVLKDSITINVFNTPTSINLGPDTTLCQNTSITLHAGPGFRSYQWQDGSTDSNLIVSLAGLYYVTAISNCGGVFRDSINITVAPTQSLHIGNDTSKCNNDTLTFTATGGFASYTWSPNYAISSTSLQTVRAWPSIDTTYKLTATTTLGCSSKDSIKINVYHSTPVSLGNDTSFCKGGFIQLNAGPGFINYLWNTGANTQQITADSVRQYIVTATNLHQCISRDTFNILAIYPNHVVNLRKDSSLCSGSNLLLDAGSGFLYRWQDGSTAQTFNVTSLGKYWVTVTDTHVCIGSDTTFMRLILPLPVNFIYSDTAICEVQAIILKPTRPFTSYLWSTGARTDQITIQSPGNYWLQVTNNSGCIAKQNIIVAPKNCVKAVYFPNAFTPNRDGINDKFGATVFGPLQKYYLVIYDRFGQKIFETADANQKWDGRYKGQDAGIGTFAWYCEYQFINEQVKKQKGSVTLFR